MAIQFTLKIDDENKEIVMQAFGATSESDLPEKMLSILMIKVVNAKRKNAQSEVTAESEIEIDED